MKELDSKLLMGLLEQRRDTRHFVPDEPVPQEVLARCLQAASLAPSVGLSEPWRFVEVLQPATKAIILQSFNEERTEAERQLEPDSERLQLHKTLKLEAITQAPLGLAVFCRYPQTYTLGTTSDSDSLCWSVACAVQNMWLSLTADGYGMGWVSILDLEALSKLLGVPDTWRPMGYLCIGKPATDYDGSPMLENEGWQQRRWEEILFKEGSAIDDTHS